MRPLPFFLLLPVLLLLHAGCHREVVRQTPLPSQAYVWQRAWTPDVAKAVLGARDFEALHVLAAEWGMLKGKTEITHIQPDWQALVGSGRRVGVVLRVHASVGNGKDGWNEALVQKLRQLCAETLARFKAGGVQVTELQLDYDCAESRLGEYARLLDALKLEVPVCITALPAWLRRDAARELLRRSPGYVLQVHSLHLPKPGLGGGMTGLMNMDETREAVRRAVEIGVPFRVALPTYSCVVEFADDGRVREVHGEDMPAGLALSGRKYAVLDADAYALSALVADWKSHASPLMQALIWYRLPVGGDRLNWPPDLLPKVASGEALKRGWTATVRPSPEGHHEIVLKQTGDAPDDLPLEVEVSWKGGAAEGSDGLRGYLVQGQGPGRLVLWLGQPARFGRVRSGEEIVVGWLRLPEAAKAELTAQIFR